MWRRTYLVGEKEVLLHQAKASRDGQQLSLLVLLSGEVGEEDHLTVLHVVLPGVALHHLFARSLRSACGVEIFLRATQSRASVPPTQLHHKGLSSYLNHQQSLGQIKAEGFPVQTSRVLLVVVDHVDRLLVAAHLQKGLKRQEHT